MLSTLLDDGLLGILEMFERIYQPTCCHDKRMLLKTSLSRLEALAIHTAVFAHEGLIEDVGPAAHDKDETRPCPRTSFSPALPSTKVATAPSNNLQKKMAADTGFREPFESS